MSEEQTANSGAPTEGQEAGSEMLEELHSLGRQLSEAVKSLWESDDSRKLRQDIGDGFVELGRQLDSAVKSAQESEAAKQFSEQVKDTVEKARASDIAGQVEEGLVTGLREMNAQLSRLIVSLEPKEPEADEPEGDVEA
jgi:chemotaxis regulatin CheY-phosphate phosphatase CheZ